MKEAATYGQAADTVVIIPTYNNSSTIGKTISDVKAYAGHIIVVNDGSTDGTEEILAKTEGIDLISYSKNRGKGHALRCGLGRAKEKGYRYAITIDADGQHFADDIPRFLSRINERPDSLLVGARNLSADGMPSENTFANKFSNFWYRVETGKRLSDTQCGFRLYPVDRVAGIRLFSGKYEFEVEIIVRAAWKGVNVENLPVKVAYPADRVSHFRPLRDFTRISILNTFLVLYALLIYYPWRFLRSLTWENIRNFFSTQVFHSSDSNIKMAASMGWGIFCGIIPIWGYQMLFALVSAHIFRLNKVVAIVFSNISVPPMIPFILYGSFWAGASLLGEPIAVDFRNISLESAGLGLLQYIIGSFALAAAAGLLATALSWLLMVIFRRK